MTLAGRLKVLLPAALRKKLGRQYVTVLERLQMASLRAAVREHGLEEQFRQIIQIVPDISHQYTKFAIDTDYLRLKVRALHAFQVTLISEAIRLIDPEKTPLTVADIGDSSGTHLRYLQGLHRDIQIRGLSVNLDEEAVRKIRGKGLEAFQARAEDLGKLGIKADVFLCLETLEHLTNPIDFLKDLSENTTCKALIITTPYVTQSRVGLHHIRASRQEPCHPESTHIFELSPADWQLLFLHAGWSIQQKRLFLQYPTRGVLRMMKRHWRKDFEGFWGAILWRDTTWSNLRASR